MQGARATSINHESAEICADEDGKPRGFWKWQFRIDDLMDRERPRQRPALFAVRRIQLQIDRELTQRRARLTP